MCFQHRRTETENDILYMYVYINTVVADWDICSVGLQMYTVIYSYCIDKLYFLQIPNTESRKEIFSYAYR